MGKKDSSSKKKLADTDKQQQRKEKGLVRKEQSKNKVNEAYFIRISRALRHSSTNCIAVLPRLLRQAQAQAHGWRDRWSDLDRQLKGLGLMLRDVRADGNCLFRAVADQIDGSEAQHARYRQATVAFMRDHEDDFAPFVEATASARASASAKFEDYCRQMEKDGAWGGNLELAALSRRFRTHIVVHQYAAPRLEVRCEEPSAAAIHLSYHDQEHYCSVRADGDLSYTPADVQVQWRQRVFSLCSCVFLLQFTPALSACLSYHALLSDV